MLLVIVAALAVSAQEAPPQRVFGPATEATFAAARDALDGALFDYPTARFREVTANEIVVCGRLNAKNRMGAYSGWQDFVVVVEPDQANAFVANEILIDAFCNERNLPQSPDYSDRMEYRQGRP